jgi:CRP/FNR family cyclic AMP-dependent transcriptional regulator
MNDVELLKQVPIFSQMDDAELSGLRGIMDLVHFTPGQGIIHEDEAGDEFYVLVEGHAQVLVMDATGAEVVVEELGPGGFFGEMSMLTDEPRAATVKAVDEATTLSLERQEFFDFLMRHPHAGIDVLTVLSRRLNHISALLRNTVSKNVNEVVEDRITAGQRIADTVAATMGSWRFIIVQSTALLIWIALNIFLVLKLRWDPYPFILLNLALSFQAAYAAPFIMMSQNRQSDKDRLAAEIDHQVNSKAELEVGLLLRRLDDLERQMHRNHREHQALLREVNHPHGAMPAERLEASK